MLYSFQGHPVFPKRSGFGVESYFWQISIQIKYQIHIVWIFISPHAEEGKVDIFFDQLIEIGLLHGSAVAPS